MNPEGDALKCSHLIYVKIDHDVLQKNEGLFNKWNQLNEGANLGQKTVKTSVLHNTLLRVEILNVKRNNIFLFCISNEEKCRNIKNFYKFVGKRARKRTRKIWKNS